MASKTTTRKPATTRAAKPAQAPAPAKPATPTNCGCGCGLPTVTARAAFVAGHDARLAGVLGRALGNGTATDAQRAQYAAVSDRLRAKIDGIAATAKRKEAAKAARAAAKQDAFDAAMASA